VAAATQPYKPAGATLAASTPAYSALPMAVATTHTVARADMADMAAMAEAAAAYVQGGHPAVQAPYYQPPQQHPQHQQHPHELQHPQHPQHSQPGPHHAQHAGHPQHPALVAPRVVDLASLSAGQGHVALQMAAAAMPSSSGILRNGGGAKKPAATGIRAFKAQAVKVRDRGGTRGGGGGGSNF
jgi:hypothetical protein